MKVFAVTTFIALLVTAIFLTNSHLTTEKKSTNVEETNDFSEAAKDGNQFVFTDENIENPSKYQDDKHESLENKHGIPKEFLETDSEEKITGYSEQFLTSKEIEETFTGEFQHLEENAIVEVANLVELAMDDYKSKKQNNEDISYFYFYRTYYPKVTTLENEIESAFEKKYTDLRGELEKHGFSPEKAEKFKQEFEIKKKEQLRQMMMMVVEGL